MAKERLRVLRNIRTDKELSPLAIQKKLNEVIDELTDLKLSMKKLEQELRSVKRDLYE